VAVALGGIAGAAAMVFLSRTPLRADPRVEGRTLREWTIWLDDESDPELRDAAWSALPQFAANDVAGPLVNLLDSNDEDTRDRATAALVTLGAPAVPKLSVAVSGPSPLARRNSIDALRQIGAPSSPAVEAIALQLADPAAGGAAAEYFIDHGAPPVAVTAALKVLADGQASRRREAIDVLARAPSDTRAVAALLREANRSPGGDAIQIAAFRAVCSLAEPTREVVDTITAGLGHSVLDPYAKRALLKIGSPAAGAVARFSDHPDAQVRASAVEVLSALAKNDPPLADSLVPFLYDSDANVSLIASEGLLPTWRGDPSLLREHLRSASPNARRWAARAVVIIKPPMMDDVVTLLDDPEEAVREHADKAVRRLWLDRDAEVLAAMKVPDPIERARLVRMLPFCRDPSQRISAMMDAMQDSDLNVRRAAVASLGQSLSFTRAVERLMDALKFDASPTLRSDAAGALAPARSTVRVAAALAEAEKDPDPAVAVAAREARLNGRALR
jgi:HEAT repeat protein